MLEHYSEKSRIAMAHNYLFQKAFNGSIKLAITMPISEPDERKYGYNVSSKPTEAEGI